MENKIINIPEDIIQKISDDVIEHFKDICNEYPRGSKKETKMCDFLKNFTDDLNETKKDDEKLTFYHQQETREGKPINNIIITKPATKNYEAAEAVALQAHLDMVCQKVDGSTHNFDTQPIKFVEIDDKDKNRIMISENNETTLGADDGIGIAFIMAVLKSTEISHPQIQAVFTSDEEDGMSGAKWLDKTKVTAKRFINIDAETESVLYYGCAGGIYANIDIPAAYTAANKNASFFKIDISGLKGGHSGLKIIEGRPNANRLMGRALNHLMNESAKAGVDVMLADISGGTAKNAITKESTAVIAVCNASEGWIDKQISDIFNMFKYEYAALEPDMKVTAESIGNTGEAEYTKVLTKDTLDKVVTAIMTVPNGVLDMSVNVPDLVETSSNLGVIKLNGAVISLTCFVRSSIESKKLFVVEQIRLIAEKIGAGFIADTDFPEWNPDVNSGLLHLFENTYDAIFGEGIVQSESVHAGLECGYFFKKFFDEETQKSVDLIAVGPTIIDAHVPTETLYLDTVPKIVSLLLNVLARMNDENWFAANKDMKRFAAPVKHKHTHNCNCMI